MYAQKSLVELRMKEINSIKGKLTADFNSLEDRLNEILSDPNPQDVLALANEEKFIRKSLATLYFRINIIEITAIFKTYRFLAFVVLILSLIVSIVGIIYIFITIYFFYTPSADDIPFAESIAALAIIPNAIGALLFVLYSKIIEQYKYFYEKLDNATDIRASDLYINTLDNSNLKAILQIAFVKNLLRRSSDEVPPTPSENNDSDDDNDN